MAENEVDAGSPRAPWPIWKKGAMGLAAALLLGGLGIQGYAAVRPAEPAAGGSAGPGATARAADEARAASAASGESGGRTATRLATGLSSGFLPRELVGASPTAPAPSSAPTAASAGDAETVSEAGAATAPQATTAERLSPILVQSGLSFFVGFCVASALRAMAKVAAIVLGLALIVIFGLQYAGAIQPIDWASLEGPFQRAVSTLAGGVGKLERSVTHTLPSGTMAGLGLAAGFKK